MGVMSQQRDALYELVKRLPERRVSRAYRALRSIEVAQDAELLEAFDGAPDDDEELSEEESQALDEARAASARGEVESWDDAWRELEG